MPLFGQSTKKTTKKSTTLSTKGVATLVTNTLFAVALQPFSAGIPGADDPGRIEHVDRIVGDALDEEIGFALRNSGTRHASAAESLPLRLPAPLTDATAMRSTPNH